MTIHDYWKLDGWNYVGHVLMNSAIDALCHYVFESCLFMFVPFYASLDPNDATSMLEKHQYRLVLWGFFSGTKDTLPEADELHLQK